MNEFLSNLSDDVLIERYREGDVHAFEVLLERYMPYIMRWIRQSADNEDDVSDLYQEITLRISLKIKSVYQGKGYFPAWVHCVVCNYLHSVYRKKQMNVVVGLSQSLLNNSKLVSEESSSITEEALCVLKGILEEQPEHLQKMIRMRFWNNYTYQEISDLTGINVSTVVKRLKTTYKKLKQMMEEKGFF